MKISTILTLCIALVFTLQAQTPTKVFGSSPPMTYFLYAINPEKILGINFAPKNANNLGSKKYLKESFLEQPVFGSFHGGSYNVNLETLINANPDLVLVWDETLMLGSIEKSIYKTKLPTLLVPFKEVEDIPNAITIIANAIGEEKRGKQLSAYADQSIQNTKSRLKGLTPKRYYYAQGEDGLATECSDSFHIVAFNFAGGENVHQCKQSSRMGQERINAETLLLYNPQVIIAQNRASYDAIYKNKLYAQITAVKNKQVYIVPKTPFNWLDRPPSFMRILGSEWLLSIFHPDAYKEDIVQRVISFYALFLDVSLTQEEAQSILRVEE